MATAPEKFPSFDPNVREGGEPDGAGYARFPVFDNVMSVDDYANAFSNLGMAGAAQLTLKGGEGPVARLEAAMGVTLKAEIAMAKGPGVAGMIDTPDMQSFARLSTLPSSFGRNLVQWPGLPAATLKKIANDHYAVHTIIQQRIADIGRYAQPSTHPWKPGWAIEMRHGLASPTETDKKDIEDATRFTLNCNAEFGWDARKRDSSDLAPFHSFLAASMRDTLRFDGMAWWTDMDLRGRVRAFKALPAANIMLATRDGFENDPNIFACGVDEVGTVKYPFTRNELTWITRNASTDADRFGYGWSEIEMTIRLIQGFTNAFDMNADIFTRDAIPPGILKLKGMWGQRQVEVMTRIWMNLKRGSTKKWALPAIPVPKDGDIELLDMTRLTDNDAYYQDYLNMVAGLFCAIYQFPVNRLGYRISGKNQPTDQKDGQSPAVLVDEMDTGLPVLLNTFEVGYNTYILWTRWPHLQFTIRGKNPKEDAREYEARKEAATFDEMRAMSDYPPMASLAKKKEHKELAELMGMAPINPNLAGVWQNLVSTYIGGKQEAAMGGPEAEVRGKTDPAASEGHGHQSGVRRDSKKETKKSYVDDAANEAEEPTAAQAAAGNYRKGHVNIGGLDVAIETPKGGIRSGTAPDGTTWAVKMPAHYGYVKKTEGADGDHVDVILGPNAHEPHNHPIHVVNQYDPGNNQFDEHKCYVGFPSRDHAIKAYDDSFSDGSGPSRRRAIKSVEFEDFKDWVHTGDTQGPF